MGRHTDKFLAVAYRNKFAGDFARGVGGDIASRHMVLVLLIGGHVNGGQITAHSAIFYSIVGSLDKTKLIDTGVSRQGANQTSIGTFRSFNGANAPVVGGVNISHRKACPLPRQSARSQSTNAPLVGQFR